MELRIDRLLDALRRRPEEILAAIDSDPLLIKRRSGDLWLANASKLLFTPQVEHHLYAKGIIYRREPFRLVSLPLLKIYNIGEREVTVRDLQKLLEAPAAVSHMLRKFDGTMVQRFQDDGRVYFTTRGMIEGAIGFGPQDEDAPDRLSHFDYLACARNLAAELASPLLEARPEWDGLTFIMELIHPETRVITDYGDRRDLPILTVFDHRYWKHREVVEFAATHGFTVVDAFTPSGCDLSEQIGSLLDMLKGCDDEGAVIAIEHEESVVYRAKVKTPDYLRLLRLMVGCTYRATAEMYDAQPTPPTWEQFEAHLETLGTEQVPEEVLEEYRKHFDSHVAYLADCERVREWANAEAAKILETLPPAEGRERRKAFAMAVQKRRLKPLLFLAFDGKLTIRDVRDVLPTAEDVASEIQQIHKSSIKTQTPSDD
jgi:hypothetical protein